MEDYYNVNIRRKEMPGNITDGVFNSIWLSNGDLDHVDVDLVKMMSFCPVIESIFREFDVPLFSLDGLVILMPGTDAETLAVFKSLLSNCKTPMMDRKVYRNLDKLFQSLGFTSSIYSPLLIENGDQEEFEMTTDEEEDRITIKDIKQEYVVTKETVDSDNNNTSEDPDHNYYVRDEDGPGDKVTVKKELLDHLNDVEDEDDEWLPRYKYQTPKHVVTKKIDKDKKPGKSNSSSSSKGTGRRQGRCRKCVNCLHNDQTPK